MEARLMKPTTLVAAALACCALTACDRLDPNSKPVYGESGLPANCRAYVQAAVDAYRMKQYTADETFFGLERNCGLYGQAWGRPK